MSPQVKIATCCHCGTRAALRLEQGRHSLSCASCGAPLRQLKALPLASPAAPAITHQPAPQGKAMPLAPHRGSKPKAKPRKKSKGKPARARLRRLWDMAEDLFDEIEDFFD